MFQQFYGFTRLPFSKSIPTGDLFDAAGQKELAARLTFLVREQGFGLVTGEFGSGKSTAVRAFAASLDANRHLVIYLTNPTTGITGLYRELLSNLGRQPPYTASRQSLPPATTGGQRHPRRFRRPPFHQAPRAPGRR